MFTCRKPTDSQIRSHLERVADAPFTYPNVGCTKEPELPLPPGWNRDHERVLLGHGAEVFERAKAAICSWRMFPPEVARLCWPDCPIEVGRTVAVLYRARPLLCWMLFPARIAYVIDWAGSGEDADRVERFGFAYGTIADHPERGEERFLVEWDRGTDEVWYDLLAVSRPGHWLARLGYPYTRYEQARFRRLSSAAMKRAAEAGQSPRTVSLRQ
jgi:uncharacterized protein (UPF0548 family)